LDCPECDDTIRSEFIETRFWLNPKSFKVNTSHILKDHFFPFFLRNIKAESSVPVNAERSEPKGSVYRHGCLRLCFLLEKGNLMSSCF
jgi:hypothetical protein